MEVLFFDRRVQDFINDLEKDAETRVWQAVLLLRDYGYQLRMPHAKMLEAGLYELRIIGHQEVRLFYTFRRSQAWILHGFIKKTMRLPESELLIARVRRNALDIT